MPDLYRISVADLRRDLAGVLSDVEDRGRVVEVVDRKRKRVRALLVPASLPAAAPAARTA